MPVDAGAGTAWEDAAVSATRSTRRSVAVLAVATTSVLLLAGCGSGQVGTIGSQVAAVNGGQATAGPLSLNNVTMAYPASGDAYQVGDDAPLLFTITNSSIDADELTSVTSPNGTVVITGNAGIAGQSTLRSVAQEKADGISETPMAPYSETPGNVRVRITGLNEVIRPGLNVSFTFTFAKAGSVTLPVPLEYPAIERAAETAG